MYPFYVQSARPRLPVLISVPHAGTQYSAALLGAARLPASALGVLEDPLVDQLVAGGVAAGAEAIIARAPRAEIDLNRSLEDLDPATVSGAPAIVRVSRRAAAGLGLIPTRLAGHGAIWRGPIPLVEVQRRIAAIHHPYHEAISAALLRMRDAFGVAVLIDCHSMPPRAAPLPPVVLGDLQGTSAADFLVDAAKAACTASGYDVARNDPYAGGEIVRRHGQPSAGIHALQIEIDRAAYLDDDLRGRGHGFGSVVRLIEAIVQAVAEAALPFPVTLAAE